MFSDDGLADIEMQKQDEVLGVDLHRNKSLLSSVAPTLFIVRTLLKDASIIANEFWKMEKQFVHHHSAYMDLLINESSKAVFPGWAGR